MPSELFEYIKSNYLNKQDRNAMKEQMERSKVKNTLIQLCDKHLTEAGQVFTFEALPRELPHVIAVIEEEPLKSKYNIYQIEETLFEASLKELDFM